MLLEIVNFTAILELLFALTEVGVVVAWCGVDPSRSEHSIDGNGHHHYSGVRGSAEFEDHDMEHTLVSSEIWCDDGIIRCDHSNGGWGVSAKVIPEVESMFEGRHSGK